MRVARYVASWLLYWPGHALSMPMRFGPFAFLYHPYNRIISASVSCQGGMRSGPWRHPTESDADPQRVCSSVPGHQQRCVRRNLPVDVNGSVVSVNYFFRWRQLELSFPDSWSAPVFVSRRALAAATSGD